MLNNFSEPLPLVSIAIPTWNRVHYLKESVESALAQTYPKLEIVISSDASTDGTRAYLDSLRDPRVRVVHQETRAGLVGNWNATLAHSTGEYYMVLNDDDLLETNAIEELVARYQEEERAGHKVGFVYGGMTYIDGDGKVLYREASSPSTESTEDLLLNMFRYKRKVLPCSLLWRRADVLPGFSPEFKSAGDAAVWMSIAIRYGSVAYVNKPLARYRMATNFSSTIAAESWINENNNLLAHVLRELAENGTYNPGLPAALKKAIERHHLQTIANGIKSNSGGRRKAFLTFFRKLPLFLHPYGLKVFAQNMAILAMPTETKEWLRRKLR